MQTSWCIWHCSTQPAPSLQYTIAKSSSFVVNNILMISDILLSYTRDSTKDIPRRAHDITQSVRLLWPRGHWPSIHRTCATIVALHTIRRYYSPARMNTTGIHRWVWIILHGLWWESDWDEDKDCGRFPNLDKRVLFSGAPICRWAYQVKTQSDNMTPNCSMIITRARP